MNPDNKFIQLHLLTFYPPSNPNRDELGEPKNAIVGGKRRSRISSQSLKRAWRTSDLWKSKGLDIGLRTRELFIQKLDDNDLSLYEKLLERDNEIAEKVVKKILDQFAKTAKVKQKEEAKVDERYVGKEVVTEQPIHYSQGEINRISSLVDVLISEDKLREPNAKELRQLLDSTALADADTAMFGRMVAKRSDVNYEAAVQVSHAISTHDIEIEQDFFTAVDDLNNHGSAHMGEQEFTSSIHYLYLCIDSELLIKNLGDKEKASNAIKVLVESAATIPPSGKQNSYANRCQSFYVLAEKGKAQPRNLSLAFLKSQKADKPEASIESLINIKTKFDTAYTKPDAEKSMSLYEGNTTLEDIIQFCGDI